MGQFSVEKPVAPGSALSGNQQTWTAIDADSDLMGSWQVGGRTIDDAVWLIEGVQARIKSHIQLTTDGLGSYFHSFAI